MNGTRWAKPIGPLGIEVVTISFSMLTVDAPLAGVAGPGQPIRPGRPRAGDDVDDPGARRRVLEQRRVHRSRRVLIEVKYRIVAEVAGEGIACSVPEIRREGRPRQILVELPAQAGRLQHFG